MVILDLLVSVPIFGVFSPNWAPTTDPYHLTRWFNRRFIRSRKFLLYFLQVITVEIFTSFWRQWFRVIFLIGRTTWACMSYLEGPSSQFGWIFVQYGILGIDRRCSCLKQIHPYCYGYTILLMSLYSHMIAMRVLYDLFASYGFRLLITFIL